MVQSKIQQAVGRDAPYVSVLPPPIIVNRAPTTSDIMPAGQLFIDSSTSPDTVYTSLGNGDFATGGNEEASSTSFGIVKLTDDQAPVATVATKYYADNLAIAGAPVSTTTVAGIGQLATDAEAVAGTPSTGVLALFVTPSNLTPVFAAPPAIGGTTPASGAFTDISATGVGTGNILTSDTASSFGVTGGGVDVTVSSSAGRVIINGEEAAADAVRILSAAGGVDLDAALQVNIASSQNAADAIRIVASAGGIDIDAVGSAGEDINITNTGASIVLSATESAADAIKIESTAGGIDILASGASAGEDIDIVATGSSVNITSTENNAGAILITENGGASGRITLNAAQGTGADSINLESTAGGITLAAALASADAINLSASAGGVDIDGALQVNIASSQNAVDAIRIVASAGGIDIDAVGAATEDINITNTGGSVVVVATESVADAIRMNASGVAGGFDIDAGTNGFIVDTTGAISLDSAAASNFTVTGAFDLTLSSSAGAVNVTSGEANADSINVTSGGGMNIVATGAAAKDVIVTCTSGSMTLTAGENVSDAMNFTASGAASGMTLTAGTSGITFSSGQNCKVTSVAAAATPYALLGTDYFIACDVTGGVLTITLPAAPSTGRYIIVSDSVGQSGANAITIDGNGKNISLAGTAAGTKTINTAYKAVGLIYNGTLWNAFSLV